MKKPNKREEIEEILTDAYGEYEQMSTYPGWKATTKAEMLSESLGNISVLAVP